MPMPIPNLTSHTTNSPLPPRESALSLLQIAVDSTLRAGVNATQIKTLVDELCANEVDYHPPDPPFDFAPTHLRYTLTEKPKKPIAKGNTL